MVADVLSLALPFGGCASVWKRSGLGVLFGTPGVLRSGIRRLGALLMVVPRYSIHGSVFEPS
jgi:hypothetical protein